MEQTPCNFELKIFGKYLKRSNLRHPRGRGDPFGALSKSRLGMTRSEPESTFRQHMSYVPALPIQLRRTPTTFSDAALIDLWQSRADIRRTAYRLAYWNCGRLAQSVVLPRFCYNESFSPTDC